MCSYECCAIQEYPNATQWYPFVYCMENYGDSMLNHVQDCATQASLSYQKIENCYQGPAGDKCVTKAAQTTNNLQPPHEYTPWVTVNGRHLAGAQHLISVVCKEIKSADKPDICAQSNDDDDGSESRARCAACAVAPMLTLDSQPEVWTDDGNTFEPCMREW